MRHAKISVVLSEARSSNRDELFCHAGEVQVPLIRDHAAVFDAHTAIARQVDARFDGHDRPGGNDRALGQAAETRLFVNLQANAVARAARYAADNQNRLFAAASGSRP